MLPASPGRTPHHVVVAGSRRTVILSFPSFSHLGGIFIWVLYRMGCIHSTTLLEKHVDLVPSPHLSNNTEKIENMVDTTPGIAVVTNANSQELQGGQEAGGGSQTTANRKVVLDGACCLASRIKRLSIILIKQILKLSVLREALQPSID